VQSSRFFSIQEREEVGSIFKADADDLGDRAAIG